MTGATMASSPVGGRSGRSGDVRGTKLSVEFLLELAASGAKQADILARYRQLTPDGLAAALHFAASHGDDGRVENGSRYATSSSAVGFLAAIIRSVRAAPDGARRPCSHS
jgi:uncharacterized protein (DUF433 family)